MMLFNKKFFLIVLLYVVYFCGILSLKSITGKEPLYWLSNVFSDKVFVYFLLPFFLWGVNVIENSFHYIHIFKYKSRKEAVISLLVQQYLHAFIYLCIWFSLVLLSMILNFGRIEGFGIQGFIENLLLYYLTFVLVVNFVAIVKRENIKSISMAACIFVYALFMIERILIVEINMYLPKDIFFMFSWVFSGREYAWIIMLGWNILGMVILLLHSAKKDLF